MRRTYLIPGLVAVLSSPLVGAQNLLDLYEAARGHDAVYLSARSLHDANLAKADQYNLLPTIELSAGSTRYDYRPTPGDARYYNTQTATITARQNLYKPGSTASYDQGKLLSPQARATLDLAEQDLMVRFGQAYFDVLTAQESLALVRAQRTANAEQLAFAKRNFEVGTATITDTHEAQARHDLTLAQEIAAQNDLAVRQLALGVIVGRAHSTPKPLAASTPLPRLDPAQMEAWVTQALSTHPSIELSRIALDTARLEVTKAEAGHKPTLEGVLTYGTTHSPTGTSTSSSGSKSHTGSAGLVFTLPLFAGFSTVHKVRETLALEDKARTDLEATRRSVGQNTRSSFMSYVASLSQVKALEAAETSSKSALEANQLGYQVGVRINIDVLNAQSQLYQTRRDLARARHDALMGYLKLRQAGGVLRLEDLQAVNALIDTK